VKSKGICVISSVFAALFEEYATISAIFSRFGHFIRRISWILGWIELGLASFSERMC